MQLAWVGEPVPDRPEDTAHSAVLEDGRVLVLVANPTADGDPELLRTFVNSLRYQRQREQLARAQ
jgi:hypothetical protein